ncbi:MAG: hypothetical protein ABI113_03605 [Mucilaginibacter sp.]
MAKRLDYDPDLNPKFPTTDQEMLEASFEAWCIAKDLLRQLKLIGRVDMETALNIDDACGAGDHYINWALSQLALKLKGE